MLVEAAKFNDGKDLSIYILPGKSPDNALRTKHNLIYEFWHNIWGQTFLSLEGRRELMSDDFCRQDEVCGIFYKGLVIGCITFNFFDLRLFANRNHSYLQSYPEEFFQYLDAGTHHSIMVMSYLAIDRNWRRTSSSHIPISSLLIGVAIKRFLESSASCLISYTRNDRSVNDLVYKFGASCIVPNKKRHAVAVDYISVERQRAENLQLEEYLEYSIHRLWIGKNLQESFEVLNQQISA